MLGLSCDIDGCWDERFLFDVILGWVLLVFMFVFLLFFNIFCEFEVWFLFFEFDIDDLVFLNFEFRFLSRFWLVLSVLYWLFSLDFIFFFILFWVLIWEDEDILVCINFFEVLIMDFFLNLFFLLEVLCLSLFLYLWNGRFLLNIFLGILGEDSSVSGFRVILFNIDFGFSEMFSLLIWGLEFNFRLFEFFGVILSFNFFCESIVCRSFIVFIFIRGLFWGVMFIFFIEILFFKDWFVLVFIFVKNEEKWILFLVFFGFIFLFCCWFFDVEFSEFIMEFEVVFVWVLFLLLLELIGLELIVLELCEDGVCVFDVNDLFVVFLDVFCWMLYWFKNNWVWIDLGCIFVDVRIWFVICCRIFIVLCFEDFVEFIVFMVFWMFKYCDNLVSIWFICCCRIEDRGIFVNFCGSEL